MAMLHFCRLSREAVVVAAALGLSSLLLLAMSAGLSPQGCSFAGRAPASSPWIHMVSDTVDQEAVRANWNRYSLAELDPLIRRWTLVTRKHYDFALRAVQRVNQEQISGDIVELGVWKGGMSMAMILQNQRHNVDRSFWLFDTFQGLPEPSDPKNGAVAKSLFAVVKEGKDPRVAQWEKSHHVEGGKLNWGPLAVVQSNILYTGYPSEKVRLVAGKVEDSLPAVRRELPSRIAILRLDTDWYESTKAELEHLYHRVVPGGLLIVDDYCAWAGANAAVKEFFRDSLGLDAEAIRNASGTPCFHYWKPS